MVPALLSYEGLGVGVGQTWCSEMSVSLTAGPASLEDDCVLSERGLNSQLLEGEDGSSVLDDPARRGKVREEG